MFSLSGQADRWRLRDSADRRYSHEANRLRQRVAALHPRVHLSRHVKGLLWLLHKGEARAWRAIRRVNPSFPTLTIPLHVFSLCACRDTPSWTLWWNTRLRDRPTWGPITTPPPSPSTLHSTIKTQTFRCASGQDLTRYSNTTNNLFSLSPSPLGRGLSFPQV